MGDNDHLLQYGDSHSMANTGVLLQVYDNDVMCNTSNVDGGRGYNLPRFLWSHCNWYLLFSKGHVHIFVVIKCGSIAADSGCETATMYWWYGELITIMILTLYERSVLYERWWR